MPTSALDIVDTAVKIGLGSAITGIASFILSKNTQTHDKEKARVQRERELLEQTADEFEAFSYSVFSYWALMAEWNRFKRGSKEFPEDRKQLLDEARRDYFVTAKGLTSAEAKLLLLGKNDSQKLLRAFADLLREFRRKVFERSTAYEEQELQDWREKILDARQKFFESLSNSFARL